MAIKNQVCGWLSIVQGKPLASDGQWETAQVHSGETAITTN